MFKLVFSVVFVMFKLMSEVFVMFEMVFMGMFKVLEGWFEVGFMVLFSVMFEVFNVVGGVYVCSGV